MDERALFEKLRRIQALYAGATTPGERAAAASARERVLERLKATPVAEVAVEYRFSLPDPWKRKLFLALSRKHGLRPYRNHGQHGQTVMLKATKTFVDDTLWPEFLALSETLTGYLDELTRRVISEAVYEDSSEAGEVRALGG